MVKEEMFTMDGLHLSGKGAAAPADGLKGIVGKYSMWTGG